MSTSWHNEDQINVHKTRAGLVYQLVFGPKPELIERRESNHMRERGTTETARGLTILESGQTMLHHPLENCEGPCALHSPVAGPWDGWPLFFHDRRKGLYRVCPHNIAHPAIEQALYWIRHGEPEKIEHSCCPECMCLPKQTLPPELLSGGVINIPSTLLGWATTSGQVDDPIKKEADPNKYARDYLDKYLRGNDTIPVGLYTVLVTRMLDEEHHFIRSVYVENGNYMRLECADGCSAYYKKRDGGEWVSTGESFCPVPEIALLAGWVPETWDLDNGDEDGDDED